MIGIDGTEFSQKKIWDTGFAVRVSRDIWKEPRIYQYFDEVNAEPVVFHWTYKLDEISEEEAKSKCS